MWLAIALEPDELHIVPCEDLIHHELGQDCICGPDIDLVLDSYTPGGLKIILHMALDGRIFDEQDFKE
jgi:hypothetical protein